jgi:hypothetical protein
MHRAILEYDRTVSHVESEMLLLNIARAHHHRPLHFTVTSNVAATFDFRSSAGIVGEPICGTVPGVISHIIGVTVAESPTVAIIPVQGEEFTKRVLAPMDEAKFEFLFHRGVNPAILLRLLAREIIIEREGTDIPIVLPNQPGQDEGYREFRRRVLHLSSLHLKHHLHIGPLLYEETWPLASDHPLTSQALNLGYRWKKDAKEQKSVLSRQVTGRFVITNYDSARLPNEERRHPGYPGGDYPLHGRIQLRSFEAILRFIGRGIAAEPEFDVDPDPRSGTVPDNPPRTLELLVTVAPPSDAAFAVEFEGSWYAIRKDPEGGGRLHARTFQAFRVLYQLFQLTVTDVARVPTFPITIAK